MFTAAQHPAAAESTAVPIGFTAADWQTIQAQANQLNNAPAFALSGSTVVVGAYGEDGDGVGDENNNDEALAGAAYAFVPAEYGVNTATAGAGTGTITLDPDVSAYPYGAVITATAVADSGSVFTGWSGDLSGTASPTTLLITGTRTITATFAVVPPANIRSPWPKWARGAAQ